MPALPACSNCVTPKRKKEEGKREARITGRRRDSTLPLLLGVQRLLLHVLAANLRAKLLAQRLGDCGMVARHLLVRQRPFRGEVA